MRRVRLLDHLDRGQALIATVLTHLNPIEQAFAKPKALLGKATERTIDAL